MIKNNQFISIGNNGLKISRIGLGCMGMSEFYGPTDDLRSVKTIQQAYELGINHFDTADIYGIAGHNEKLLGKALKGLERNKVVVATKAGFVKDSNNNIIGLNGSPEHIKVSCENSLKNLGVDYIDLFYLHRVDPNTPLESSMQALSDLVKEGKILNIGLSAVGPETIAQAHKMHNLTAIQSEYSIISRDVEHGVLQLCKQLNIGFIAYGPTGWGFLTGKLNSLAQLTQDDARRGLPRLQDENIKHNLEIVDILSTVAKRKQCTIVQVALAWLLAQGDHIAAIPGTKRIPYLKENAGSMDVQLSDHELAELNKSIPFRFAKGDRIPRQILEFTNTYALPD